MPHPKIGVLLVNLGTPDSPSVSDVRKYLKEFLMDRRVIDIAYWKRTLLVKGIIAPFRAPKSAKEYKKLWTEKGSPLMFHGVELRKKVQEVLGETYQVELAMRYQTPSIASVLEKFKNREFEKIIVLPLFPQYASATTGSVLDKVQEIIKDWEVIPQLDYISKYPNHPKFIQAFGEKGLKYISEEQYDHVLFSFHGLPERHIRKSSIGSQCKLGTCCEKYNSKNAFCYRAQCFETARKIAEFLKLPKENYSVAFQSRLGRDPWVQPYLSDAIDTLIKKDIKKVLVYSPAFVADCLETSIELGEEYKEDFESKGGEKLQLVESLNTSPLWVECIQDLVLNH
jgi:ferrochelatase